MEEQQSGRYVNEEVIFSIPTQLSVQRAPAPAIIWEKSHLAEPS